MGEKGEMGLSSCFPDVWIRSKQMCWGGEQGLTGGRYGMCVKDCAHR